MEGSDSVRREGKPIRTRATALVSKAPNERPRIGCRGRGKTVLQGNNGTRRQHGLEMSRVCGPERRNSNVRGGMREHKGRK